MLLEFINFIKEEKLLGPADRTLLAVSGGVDSVVMTDLFNRAGFAFDMAHVNFHLRQEESDRDEIFVRELAEKYKVKIFVRHYDTEKYSAEKKVSVQVAARELRYLWFEELAGENGYTGVATAHHLDDQVETFLINLARGTGISGLHGIVVKQGKIIRPLMFTNRNMIETYAGEQNLDFVEDSSNLSLKYTRNRIRHRVIPQMEKINPAFRKEISKTIAFIRDTEIIYRQAVEEKKTELLDAREEKIFISAEKFYLLEPLATWAFELLSPFGFNHSNIQDIISLRGSIPGKEVLSGSYRLIRDREYLIIEKRKTGAGESDFIISEKDILSGGIDFPVRLAFNTMDPVSVVFDNSSDTAYLDFDRLVFPLTLRKWKKGDYFFPLGMIKKKKLSDFFTDLKLSMVEKEDTWLLCSGADIAWVIGYRISEKFKISAQTLKVLKIRSA